MSETNYHNHESINKSDITIWKILGRITLNLLFSLFISALWLLLAMCLTFKGNFGDIPESFTEFYNAFRAEHRNYIILFCSILIDIGVAYLFAKIIFEKHHFFISKKAGTILGVVIASSFFLSYFSNNDVTCFVSLAFFRILTYIPLPS